MVWTPTDPFVVEGLVGSYWLKCWIEARRETWRLQGDQHDELRVPAWLNGGSSEQPPRPPVAEADRRHERGCP